VSMKVRILKVRIFEGPDLADFHMHFTCAGFSVDPSNERGIN
jgi:hypothetical protein